MGGRVVAKGCGRATPVGSTGWRPSATLTLFEREQARTPRAPLPTAATAAIAAIRTADRREFTPIAQ